MGRHVCMVVVDDVLSKLKAFSFNKGKVIEVVVRIGSSLHFHRERDLYLSLLQVRIVAVGSCEGEMSYQYQSVYPLY